MKHREKPSDTERQRVRDTLPEWRPWCRSQWLVGLCHPNPPYLRHIRHTVSPAGHFETSRWPPRCDSVLIEATTKNYWMVGLRLLFAPIMMFAFYVMPLAKLFLPFHPFYFLSYKSTCLAESSQTWKHDWFFPQKTTCTHCLPL